MAEETKAKISTFTHPIYTDMISEWQKFRAAYTGGMAFVITFLQKYSTRESDSNFELRRKVSYCPAHAKAAIQDVKNSIYQRLSSVEREGGPNTYQEAIGGANRGVDFQGRSMANFIGTQILEELIVMSKVGVYIDKPEVDESETVLEAKDKRPYLYYYPAESIKAWSYDNNLQLNSLLLEDSRDVKDETTGLVIETAVVYRHLHLTDAGVVVTFYDDKDIVLGSQTLNLKRIPFVLFEISSSLMTDVADYQVALLNLASSDMVAIASNFPFYVEQYNPQFDMNMLKQAGPDDDGSEAVSQVSKDKKFDVGTTQGRRYPKGLDQPAFINPSSEPLVASMKKQDTMQKEIRQIINLSIANLEPTRASDESKQQDDKGLEAGLSYIGMELEYGEQEIAEIWAMYEGSTTPATVIYPTDYKLLSDEERRQEAKDCEEMMGKIPSHTYKQVMAKKIVKLTIGNKSTPDLLARIDQEIDSAVVIISDSAVVRSDHEAGLVGDQLASQLRGYPDGEYLIAQEDHAKRATRVLAAQTSNMDSGARGVDDLGTDPDAAAKEKANSQDPDLDDSGKSKTRGKAK